MKWCFILVSCLLFSTLQLCAQSPVDSLAVHNKQSQTENKQKETVKARSPKVRKEQKSPVISDTIRTQQEGCDSLLRRTRDLGKIINAYKAVYGEDEYNKAIQGFRQNQDVESLEGQKEQSQAENKQPKRKWNWGRATSKKEQENHAIQPKQENCDSLSEKTKELEAIINAYKAVYGGDEYIKALIETPLEKVCDTVQINYHKQLIDFYVKDGLNDDVMIVYEVYYPLLERYEVFNNELKVIIWNIVRSFEGNTSNPNKDLERDAFYQSLRGCSYYREYRYKSNVNQEIVYLEEVIGATKELFEDPSKFTKENFLEQFDKLSLGD